MVPNYKLRAMSFFDRLKDVASGIVRYATNSGAPHEVQEIKVSEFAKMQQIAKEESLTLYKDGGMFYAVLYHTPISSKPFSLFKLQSDQEAMILFTDFASKLYPLYITSRRVYDEEMLQHLCDAIRKYPGWTSAHLAAAVGLQECFRDEYIRQQLNSICEVTSKTPIHVAVESGVLECIQELLVCGVDLNLADQKGNNVFHYAAEQASPQVIQFLASKDKSVINQLNLDGESPLHTACLKNRPQNVEHLLRWGADPNLTRSKRFPIHCAMKACSAKCLEVLIKWNKGQIEAKDSCYGGTPLHWARNKECIDLLIDLGANLEAKNFTNDTPLLIMVCMSRFDCVMSLLMRGADASTVGHGGNNALHLAIKNQTGNLELVKALIVFGTDVNGTNKSRETPLHLASLVASSEKDNALYVLHRVGAKRCPEDMERCMEGCASGGSFNGKPPGKTVVTPESPVHELMYQDTVNDIALAAAMTRSESATGSAILTGDIGTGLVAGGAQGDRVLCLDGGGIRGLVLIQILLAIEKAVGKPIKSCFDWIAGTSTGGILALALAHGKSLRYGQGLYFRLKNEIFVGKRPYSEEGLEKFMKKEFGDNTRMSEVEYPKLLVTGTLADRFPPQLHLFRNYEPPGIDYNDVQKKQKQKAVPRSTEQYVWRAARSSGAAPTYFRAAGRFLDGGLIANNPTLDTLTEIHKFNTSSKALGLEHQVRPLHVVVSVGTGLIPEKELKSIDVYKPEGILDVGRVAVGAHNLMELLLHQATASDGEVVERAQAWCSMIHVPYFRFNPNLSEEVQLDCTDNATLVNMLWETQCYINEKMERIQMLAMLLTQAS